MGVRVRIHAPLDDDEASYLPLCGTQGAIYVVKPEHLDAGLVDCHRCLKCLETGLRWPKVGA